MLPAWVSAVEAQTGLAARLPVKREPQYRPPEELPHGSFVRSPGLQLLSGNYQKDTRGPQQKTRVSGGLSRALYCRHIAVLPPLSPIWGGTPMWVTLRDQIWSKI